MLGVAGGLTPKEAEPAPVFVPKENFDAEVVGAAAEAAGAAGAETGAADCVADLLVKENLDVDADGVGVCCGDGAGAASGFFMPKVIFEGAAGACCCVWG